MSNLFNQPSTQAFPHSAGTAHMAGQAMAKARLAATERANVQAHARMDAPNSKSATGRLHPNAYTPLHMQTPPQPQARGKARFSAGGYKNKTAYRARKTTAGFKAKKK